MEVELTRDEVRWLRWLMGRVRIGMLNESGRVVVSYKDKTMPVQVSASRLMQKFIESLEEESSDATDVRTS